TFRFVIFSPDGTRVAATFLDMNEMHHLEVRDLTSGEPLFSASGAALAYSPDGRWLVVAEDEVNLLLLDARTHVTVARLRGHEKEITWAAFSSDSRRLASCGFDRSVRVWDIEPRTLASEGEGGVQRCQVLRGHTDIAFAVAFHPDGTRLAT